jgi:hypothetical protein
MANVHEFGDDAKSNRVAPMFFASCRKAIDVDLSNLEASRKVWRSQDAYALRDPSEQSLKSLGSSQFPDPGAQLLSFAVASNGQKKSLAKLIIVLEAGVGANCINENCAIEQMLIDAMPDMYED